MKSILFVFFLTLLSLIGCTKKSQEAVTTFKVSFGALLDNTQAEVGAGGAFVYGLSSTGQYFSFNITNETTVSQLLPSGSSWTFYGLAWEGGVNGNFTGKTRCAYATANLSGATATVNLDFTNATCDNTAFAGATANRGSLGNKAFQAPQIQTCRTLIDPSNPNSGGRIDINEQSCDYVPADDINLKGYATGYKFRISPARRGLAGASIGSPLMSNCLKVDSAFGSGLEVGSAPIIDYLELSLPIGNGQLDFNLELIAYYGTDPANPCSNTTDTKIISLSKGINTPSAVNGVQKVAFADLSAQTNSVNLYVTTDDQDVCTAGRQAYGTKASPVWSSGFGTTGHPYTICNHNQFRNLTGLLTGEVARLSDSYKLMKHINFWYQINLTNQTGGLAPIEPIGTQFSEEPTNPTPFNGTFDGNGKQIIGMMLDLSSATSPPHNSVGLFRNLGSSGKILNLNMIGPELRLDDEIDFAGAVAGASEGLIRKVIVKNASMDGKVYVGGIVGYQHVNGKIQESQVIDASIYASRYLGGLIGFAEPGDTDKIILNSLVKNSKLTLESHESFCVNKNHTDQANCQEGTKEFTYWDSGYANPEKCSRAIDGGFLSGACTAAGGSVDGSICRLPIATYTKVNCGLEWNNESNICIKREIAENECNGTLISWQAGQYAGGLIGVLGLDGDPCDNTSTLPMIESSASIENLIEGHSILGGLIGKGYIGADCSIANSYSTSSIISDYHDSAPVADFGARVGGIIGQLDLPTNATVMSNGFFSKGSLPQGLPEVNSMFGLKTNAGNPTCNKFFHVSNSSAAATCNTTMLTYNDARTYSSMTSPLSVNKNHFCPLGGTVVWDNNEKKCVDTSLSSGACSSAFGVWSGTQCEFSSKLVLADNGFDIPRLWWEEERDCHNKFASISGTGTQASPFEICSRAHLTNGTYFGSGKHAILKDNIDMTGYSVSNTVHSNNAGTFNGNNKTISNLLINSTVGSNAGFIATNNGTVKNLKFANARVSNSAFNTSTGIVAAVNSATGIIENVSVDGLLNPTEFAGTIAGNNAGVIANATSKAEIKIEKWDTLPVHRIGGIAGKNSGLILFSKYEGHMDIKSKTEVGELDGNNGPGEESSDVEYIGGLVGENSDGATCTSSPMSYTPTIAPFAPISGRCLISESVSEAEIDVEHNFDANNGINYISNGVGYNKGRIENVLIKGDFYYMMNNTNTSPTANYYGAAAGMNGTSGIINRVISDVNVDLKSNAMGQAATAIMNGAGGGQITVTASMPGIAGNSIQVQWFVNDAPPSSSLVGSMINLFYDNDGAGNPQSTYTDIVTAFNSGPANAMIVAAATANPGASADSLPNTPLSGGTDPGVTSVSGKFFAVFSNNSGSIINSYYGDYLNYPSFTQAGWITTGGSGAAALKYSDYVDCSSEAEPEDFMKCISDGSMPAITFVESFQDFTSPWVDEGDSPTLRRIHKDHSDFMSVVIPYVTTPSN